jgi:NitT/TauT family transport system permease protein
MKAMQYGGGEDAEALTVDGSGAVASDTASAPAPHTTKPRSSLAGPPPTLLLGLSGVGLLLVLWWLGTDVFADAHGFARKFSPTAALPALVELAMGPNLWLHIAASLKRVVVGLALSLGIGIPIGLVVGASRLAEASTSPAYQFLRMTSPLSWMPIAIMIFGIGDVPIYFLLAFAAVWPILLNTATGVRQLDRQWLLLGKSLAATRFEMLRHIIIPGILGHVLTGVRLAIGISWIVLVPCEMLGVQAGLGYFILDTRDRLAYPELMATIVAVGITGFFLDVLARAIARRFSPTAL